MQSRRILVTGGAGFIGGHLCERLLKSRHEIWCLDNFETGCKDNLRGALASPHFHLITGDVREPLPDLAVDRIYNLACPTSPQDYQRDPIGTMRANVLGALNVLDLARARGARVLQASTSEVYGDPEVHPQTETCQGAVNCTGPRACYDEGKRAAETLFYDYNRQHGVQIRVARLFNTYGPGMRADDGRVIPNFVTQALRGEPITLYGTGLQTRSFCYVSDMIDALIALMEAPGDRVGPVNLGNPQEITMQALAARVRALTGSVSNMIHLPLPQDDPKVRCPDITRAREVLDWAPAVDLDAGLKETIAWYRHAPALEHQRDRQRQSEPI